MELYIFDRNEELQLILKSNSFMGNECMILDAKHLENLEGDNTFTFTVNADHPDANYVREGNYVAFKEDTGRWQMFTMMKKKDRHGTELTRTMYCEHAYYELIEDVITDKRPRNVMSSYAMKEALDGTRWTVGKVDELGINSTNFYFESNLAAALKVKKIWGGEFEFYLLQDIDGLGGIFDRKMDYVRQRGEDTGKQYVFGKDVETIERDVDITQLVTALYGIGASDDDGGERKARFEEVIWQRAYGKPADKPYGQLWVGDEEARLQWGRSGRHIFDVVEFDTADENELLQLTYDALQLRKKPIVTYSLTVFDLERAQDGDYGHERVRIGDVIRVIDEGFSPPLYESIRVMEIERDLLSPLDTKVVLGTQRFEYLQF